MLGERGGSNLCDGDGGVAGGADLNSDGLPTERC
jgi:hypothetical protein